MIASITMFVTGRCVACLMSVMSVMSVGVTVRSVDYSLFSIISPKF